MKTLKRITSFLVAIMLVFSLGLCAFGESTPSELQIEYYNVITNNIYLEFSGEISQITAELTTMDKSKTIALTASIGTDKKAVTLKLGEKMDITRAYELEFVATPVDTANFKTLTSKKYIVFEVLANENFENCTEELTELDDTLVVKPYDYASSDIKISESKNSGEITLMTEESGNKYLKVKMTNHKSFFVKGLVWNHKYKYYNFEADITPFSDGSNTFGLACTNYVMENGKVNLDFFKYGHAKYWTRNFTSIFMDGAKFSDLTNIDATVGKFGTIAASLNRNETSQTDVFNLYDNGTKKLTQSGTVANLHNKGAFSGAPDNFFFLLKSTGTFGLDNYKLYAYRMIDEKEIENVQSSPVLSGEFENGKDLTLTFTESLIKGFDTTYEYKWIKTTDSDAPMSQWTEIENGGSNSKTLTVSADNCDVDNDYVACEVTRTVKLDSENYLKTIKYYSNTVSKPRVPECKNITMNYNRNSETNSAALEAVPTYYDANSDAEDKENATFNWEISDDNQNWTAFDGTKSDANDYKNNVIDVTNVTDKYVRCTVSLKALTGENDTLQATAKTQNYTLPFKPVAKNVSISGTSTVGSLLTGSYTYYDENEDEENLNKTVTEWYRRTPNGDVKVGNGLNYSISTADSGYSIVFKVTPVTDNYPEIGDTVESSNAITVATAIVPSTSVGGTSGGSSGGGSYSSSSSNTTTTPSPEFKPVPEEKEPAFSDIKGHWAKDTIEKLNEKGLVNGKENGFEPDSALTRAEWITLLLRAIGADFEGTNAKNNVFGDVKKDDWFAKAVLFAYENNLVNGTDGNFNPNDNVTREQMAKMLIDVLEYFLGEDVDMGELSFTDNASISQWAEQYVQKAVSKGLITGTPEGTFNPSSQATRAEACTVLLRLLNIIGK